MDTALILADADRYLKIVAWAERRYRNNTNGLLYLSVGGKPTTYSRIERAAFDRYVSSLTSRYNRRD
jgi:hypothetical protein